MSPSSNSGQALDALPAYPPPPPPRGPSTLALIARFFAFLMIVGSFALNLILLLVLILVGGMRGEEPRVRERHYSGTRRASDKIAIVRIEGVILEGTLGFARRQIEQAATDAAVKSVVLRINSPGGSVTASDNLYQRIVELRDGNTERGRVGKPIVVSMGSLAASGGYYIAMPAKTLVAERTTMTGSIGVYAAFPNIAELGNKIGFSMNVIKAGAVKDSGSPFQAMPAKERLLFQDMVDRMYLQFLHIVEEGRPALKGKLQKDIVVDDSLPVRDDKTDSQQLKYTRYRADGGIFMADQAVKYGLIDQIGYLDDAVKIARQTAALTGAYEVVMYEKPYSFLGALLGEQSDSVETRLDYSRISEAAIPRFWYVAPQAELAGIFAALKK
jgi:protease-4